MDVNCNICGSWIYQTCWFHLLEKTRNLSQFRNEDYWVITWWKGFGMLSHQVTVSHQDYCSLCRRFRTKPSIATLACWKGFHIASDIVFVLLSEVASLHMTRTSTSSSGWIRVSILSLGHCWRVWVWNIVWAHQHWRICRITIVGPLPWCLASWQGNLSRPWSCWKQELLWSFETAEGKPRKTFLKRRRHQFRWRKKSWVTVILKTPFAFELQMLQSIASVSSFRNEFLSCQNSWLQSFHGWHARFFWHGFCQGGWKPTQKPHTFTHGLQHRKKSWVTVILKTPFAFELQMLQSIASVSSFRN